MLKECWQWLRADADLTQRRLGYVGEAVAIQARFARCQHAWQHHLDQSKQFIVDAINRCNDKRTVLVLGAGACLDVPLDALSAAFERVLLVDAVVLRSATMLPSNVEWVMHDITEINQSLMQIKEHAALQQLTTKTPQRFCDDTRIDLVISLNLLSQLPLMPMRFLQERGWKADVVNQFGLDLMRAHLRYLGDFSAETLLLYDAEQWQQRSNGLKHDVVELETWVRNVTALWPLQRKSEWLWQVAPQGELAQPVQHRVQALHFGAQRV